MMLFVITGVPLSHMHCKYRIFLQPPLPKKTAKPLEMEVFGGYHAENKDSSVVPPPELSE